MKNISFIALLSILLFSLMSCSPKLNSVRTARISNQDTEIKTLNGNRIAKSGTIFTPSNQSSYAFRGPFGSELFEVNDALQNGAVRVKVSTPYHPTELFGVLLCSKVYDCSNEPTTRSYEISVSNDMVQKALAGKTSCAYEYYECGSKSYTTWVLWLSDIQF